MSQIEPDPVIDEVREVRHQISARFDHDPERLVAYYVEYQKQFADRLLVSGDRKRIKPAA
jgi:hypothetical protein